MQNMNKMHMQQWFSLPKAAAQGHTEANGLTNRCLLPPLVSAVAPFPAPFQGTTLLHALRNMQMKQG
jgi:hypothetical protein